MAYSLCQMEKMGRQKDGHLLLPTEPLDQFHHPVGRIRIQTECGFIEKGHFWILDQEFGDSQTLPHSP